jgi:hypothetical protein
MDVELFVKYLDPRFPQRSLYPHFNPEWKFRVDLILAIAIIPFQFWLTFFATRLQNSQHLRPKPKRPRISAGPFVCGVFAVGFRAWR